MAHGVRRAQPLKLHQVLHGYADGHRQLAASTQLKPRDAKMMLVLSDLSGPGAPIDAGGYLTGYPLGESKMYAVARTWPAPEMSRPGCVWTHTLLIDFADIALLADAAMLLSSFRRPSNGRALDYAESLEVPLSSLSKELPTVMQPHAQFLLAALYERPNHRVVASRPTGVDVDALVLAVWSQQWPRLRRAFRFCTHTSADRSTEGNSFDLQYLTSSDRSTRARFPTTIETSESGDDSDWLRDALLDLMQPGPSDLRLFLRRIGGDVPLGRQAFKPLCRLHALVERFGTKPKAIDAAIGLLDAELGSAQARTARGLVATAALVNPSELDEVATDFLLRHLDLVPSDVVSTSGRALGDRVWELDPARFSSLLDGGERQRSIAESTIAEVDLKALTNGILQAPQLATVAFELRPEMVTVEDFWRHSLVAAEIAFAALKNTPDLRSAALEAMILADRDDLAPRVVREIGGLSLLQQIAPKIKSADDARGFAPWLRITLTDPSVVANFLSAQSANSWAILSAIASSMPPDAVPNEYGTDPWLLAVESVATRDPSRIPIFLSVFLLSRALGRRSRNSGELARLSFEHVHEAARLNETPDDAWSLLQDRLPWSFSWLEWDRCARIRAAVGDLFVDRELQPQLFAGIASDDLLFDNLSETISRSYRGRQFLKRVRRWMKEDSSIGFASRIGIIEQLVK
jgi:hypothetical protein